MRGGIYGTNENIPQPGLRDISHMSRGLFPGFFIFFSLGEMRGRCEVDVALYARAGEGVHEKSGKSAYTRPPECGRVGVPRGEESTTYREGFYDCEKSIKCGYMPFLPIRIVIRGAEHYM